MFPRSSLVPALLLFLTVQILSTGDCWTGSQKQRHKREWVVPAKQLTENVDYSHSPKFTKIRSDIDEFVKLRYTIRGPGVNQPPVGYFILDNQEWVCITRPLDREERQHYTEHKSFVLTVQAADMYGSPKGNSATATVFIDILDVNDNIPTLEKDEFSASIDENEAPVEVMRIQALDNDEERTDNWLAEFKIVSGNEDGRFSIQTDPKTNMGVLYLNKPVDFESGSDMNLNLVVANKAHPGAPLESGAGASGAGGGAGASGAGGGAGASGTGGGAGASGAAGGGSVLKQKTYPVRISVKNKPEGPKFKPKIKPISVSENTKNSVPRVIDTYTAIEEDTGKTAEKVKYAKAYDPDNWISIDTDTAEIKLNKVPDRESPFVVNGTYYAKILCITDELHSQTSTGTIALQVEDLNDNCPKLLNNVQTVCHDTRVVNVTAEDEDSDPNGAPLEFSLIQEKTRGRWNLQRINDVSVSMLAEDDLWPGFYEVTMEIRDKQGLACPDEQVLRLEVCTCSEGTFCASKLAAVRTTSASLGAAGIGLLLLGFLCIILALAAIIKCECGNAGKHFTDMPFETKHNLMPCSAEGKGIAGDVLRMSIPAKLYNKVTNSNQAVCNSSKMVGMMQESAFGGFYSDIDGENSVRWQEGQVSLDAFLKEYYTQKSSYILDNDSPIKGLQHYGYEGEGSVTGSIESCSFIESNDDLEFLNNLGPKFNTLAKVCGFRQTDPNVVVNTVETTPNADASSSHMTNIIQPSPEEIPVKSPLVQPAPSKEVVIQEPMYYGFNQPMARNVVLSEDGLGQGVYIINGAPEAERILTQGNGHTLAHLGSGQQAVLANNIIGDSVLYSQIGPQSPVMITEGLGTFNPAVVQTLSPTQNLVMMPQQQLDGIGSLQMVRVPVESVVSGENGQGRVTLMDGSVNGGKVFVGGLGPSHCPMSPQLLYPVNSQELVAGPGQFPVSMSTGAPNLVRLTQVANGHLPSVQNIVSGEGGQSRPLVSGPTILEGPSQLPLAMSPGVLSPFELPQVANRQLFRSTVSRVLTSMAMMPKSKGLATNGQLDVEQ